MRRVRSLPAEYRPKRTYRGAFVYVHLFSAGLMTVASAVVIVVHPFWATVFLLFFGFSAVLAEADRRTRFDDGVRGRIEPFRLRLRRGNIDGYAVLLRVLASMDGRTPRARRRARVALDALVADERLMDGKVVHCRHHQISVSVFGDRLGRRFGPGALVPALASLHRDGRVREAAVTAMAGRLRPAHLPFLVERAVDWAPQVRTVAQDVLRTELVRRPELLPQARSAYARIARRRHAPAVAQLIDGV